MVTAYHVTLGGQGLMLDLASYRRRPARTFAPRQATGAPTYADQLLEQVWALDDWSGGQGFTDFDPDNPGRYRNGLRIDTFSQPGALQVGPDLQTSSSSTNNGLRVLRAFNDRLYAGSADGKVYVFTGTSWSQAVDLAKPAGITAMEVYKNELYVANGTDNTVAKVNAAGTWTNPAFTGTGLGSVESLLVFDPNAAPTLHVAGPGAANGEDHRWNGSSFSTAIFTVPERSLGLLARIEQLLWCVGLNKAAMQARIWSWDNSVPKPFAEWPDNYPVAAVVWQGAVWYGMARGGELWRWNGKTLELIASGLTGASDPLFGLAVWRGALWAACREGTELVLRRFDGEQWSTPVRGGALNNASGAARELAVFQDRLYAAGERAGAAPIYRVAMGTYETDAPAELETGLFAAGLPGMAKVFRWARVQHAPLAAGQSIELQYRLEDSGPWLTLGTSGVVGATSAEFTFPSSAIGRLLGLKLRLTATASASPRLYAVLVGYVLAPALKREWEFTARCEGTPEMPLITLDHQPAPQTGAQISAALWSLKSQAGPQPFQDLDGASYQVWFLELEERMAERSQRLGPATLATCRLVEA